MSLTNITFCILPGAHEPPKAAKEHATYATCQVPSQSKFIVINCQLPLNSFHIWKAFGFVIEIISEKIWKLLKMRNVIWIVMEPSCMLLHRLRQLMGSWYYISLNYAAAINMRVISWYIHARVHNKYIEESILLSCAPVEGRIVKFWRKDKMLWFLTYKQP